ncbi:MAG: 23S rRNA (pseudouridine(1915)-N(3))-methyltransferase RlmH [Deltaproteobacteria bacterium]|nr:23S rRNA (pseudouridine(1915)-N(3))-methyltransferase RlmH [Deltaproteobacteria bacterium]
MKITFISVGQVKKRYVKEGVDEYLKRIKKHSPVDVIDIKEESASIKMPVMEVLKREGERILYKIRPGEYIVALSDNGKNLSSLEFAEFIGNILSGGTGSRKGITFIIGGPFGLHKDVTGAAHFKLALSKMTFPHDLARLVLAEQVYRAFTILRNEPYSH